MTMGNSISVIGKLSEFIKERRFPSQFDRFVYKKGLVNRKWYYRLKAKNLTSTKLKIGFGPVRVGEGTLGVRKWRIDPLINLINKTSSRYVSDIFFDGEDLQRFDIIVIVKFFNRIDRDVIDRLKRRGKVFVYDALDIRLVPTEDGERDIYTDPDVFRSHYVSFLQSMDAVLIINPLQERDLDGYGLNLFFIETPIINRTFKSTYTSGHEVSIVWQGHPENREPMQRLHPMIEKIRAQTGRDVRLVYHTDIATHDDGFIRYVAWRMYNWDKVLAECDIAVVIKPSDDAFQQRKPCTKVQAYMGAGLPVVCTPTQADKRIIEHGRTGFFAYNEQQWYEHLKALVESPQMREQVGRAARASVCQDYDLPRITGQYLDMFDSLLAAKRP